MKTNIIYACKKKLIGIDATLPLLMELKARFARVNIIILFPDEYNLQEIQKNYHIWKALDEITPSRYCLKHKSRLKRYCTWLWVVFRMLFRKNIIIKQADSMPYHGRFISFIKKFSDTSEIYAHIAGWTIEFHRSVTIAARLRIAKRRNTTEDIVLLKPHNYDYFISSLDRAHLADIYKTEIEQHKFIQIGYHRKLPQWFSFVERQVRLSELHDQNYFLYILSGIKGNRWGLDEPDYEELLEETLSVLKKYNASIKTVFKPHIFTDLEDLRILLDKLQYSNYTIDYGHPMVLAANAQFVMNYFFSTTLFDAYYLNTPVVSYSQVDPEYFELIGRKSEGGTACDFFCTPRSGRVRPGY